MKPSLQGEASALREKLKLFPQNRSSHFMWTSNGKDISRVTWQNQTPAWPRNPRKPHVSCVNRPTGATTFSALFLLSQSFCIWLPSLSPALISTVTETVLLPLVSTKLEDSTLNNFAGIRAMGAVSSLLWFHSHISSQGPHHMSGLRIKAREPQRLMSSSKDRYVPCSDPQAAHMHAGRAATCRKGNT